MALTFSSWAGLSEGGQVQCWVGSSSWWESWRPDVGLSTPQCQLLGVLLSCAFQLTTVQSFCDDSLYSIMLNGYKELIHSLHYLTHSDQPWFVGRLLIFILILWMQKLKRDPRLHNWSRRTAFKPRCSDSRAHTFSHNANLHIYTKLPASLSHNCFYSLYAAASLFYFPTLNLHFITCLCAFGHTIPTSTCAFQNSPSSFQN